MHKVDDLINRIVLQLKKDQAADGSWHYPFETGISTDAYMIILLRTLEIDDEELIRALVVRILSKQEKNGAWKLFYDEDHGNISLTVEAYYSLLYSGYIFREDERLLKAKRFILSNGGIEQSHMFTKIMLAITGQYRWPTFFPIPVELILLPHYSPINFYDFSVYGRANLAPIMILFSKKYSNKTKRGPYLGDLFTTRGDEFFNSSEIRNFKTFFSLIGQAIKSIIGFPHYIHQASLNRARQYMLEHLEPDGTLYSYFSSTFLMIFALVSLGYSKSDPVITKAINGLKEMKCDIEGNTHMQYTTAHVWNTSLISYSLQKTGVSEAEPVIKKANTYLLERQHSRYGDWAIHNPGVIPGGWGFSDINTMHPDVDDTTASLRALLPISRHEPQYRQAWILGTSWIYSMQNQDGGWPAFEKNVDKAALNLIPIEGGKFLLTDPSSADLTGRTLEFLGHYSGLPINHKIMKRGTNWLFRNQEQDGSWYGRWGICYIYGTWASLTGLMAAGINKEHFAVRKSINWLKRIQNPDGGWGESCKSDMRNHYVPLSRSTLTHTAWALDALIAAENEPTPEIQAGISYLLDHYDQKDWTNSYPAGQGMGGGFYIHYHSYQYIFPLLALGSFKRKFS